MALDWQEWLRAVAALLATLALIGALAYGARRLGMMQANAPSERRLRLVESLMIDPRRRLVIVRWDDREHLLLLGAGGDKRIADAPVKQGERT
jgi:flagellar protein FliO/FliZ